MDQVSDESSKSDDQMDQISDESGKSNDQMNQISDESGEKKWFLINKDLFFKDLLLKIIKIF